MKKNKKDIFISVVIPTYNSKKFIIECLTSVINQTYKNIEVIIVDDCSTDNTIEIIKKFINKRKFPVEIKIFKTKINSKTVAAPRNFGVTKSKGDYIAFIDSDDIWHTRKIEYQVNNLQKNSIVCTSATYFAKGYKSGFFLNLFRKGIQNFIINKLNKKNGELWLYLYNPIVVSSVMVSKKILKENPFNEDINFREDLSLWYGLTLKKLKIIIVDKYLTFIRRRNDSLSSNFKKEFIVLIKSLSETFFKSNRFEKINFFLIGIFVKFFIIFYKLNYKNILKKFKIIFFILIFSYFSIYYTPLFYHIGKNLLYYDDINKEYNNLVLYAGHGTSSDYRITSLNRYEDIKIISESIKINKVFIVSSTFDLPQQKIIQGLLESIGINKDNVIISFYNFQGNSKDIKNTFEELKINNIEKFIFVTDPFYTREVVDKWKINKNFKILVNKSSNWPVREKFFEYTKNKKIIVRIYIKKIKTFFSNIIKIK